MAGTCTMTLQAHGTPTYYPKRAADDGLIYWCDTSVEIYNLIRAVTRPFPGAFTYLDDDPAQRVLVWRGIPFDTKITWPAARPGQIVQVFEGGSFVVRTGDASLLVLESEGCEITHEHIGRRLGDLNTPRKVWQDLPA
jgi:methionyl-tRNA formyltransferase